ncbi:hypothetical protein ACROYT_G008523, partial [Oculina patagonica]
LNLSPSLHSCKLEARVVSTWTKHSCFRARSNTFTAFKRHTSVISVERSNTQIANMKPQSAKPSLSVEEDPLRATATTGSSITRARARGSSVSQVEQGCIYNMSDCYDRLRAMVPHISANRRMSKVEILQNVIDYIQDLESALELPNLQMSNFVNDSTDSKTGRVPLSTISYNC